MTSRRRLLTAIALAVGVAAALLIRLSHPGLHVDEVTYMSSVLESMAQESVLPVQGDGELFMNKPPVSLWLMRAAFAILGPSPFAARLPSVLAAAATVAVLYLFGAAAFGERVGIAAALILAFTPGVLVLHGLRSATPDALEILLVTSAIVLLEIRRRGGRPWTLAGLVACMAASAWVKSPFALAVFLAYLLATELPARRAGRGTPRFAATVAWVAGAWIGAYLLWLGAMSAATSPRVVFKRLFMGQYVRRIEGRIGESHVQGPGFYLTTTVRDFGPLLLLPVGAAVAAGLMSRGGLKDDGSPSRSDVACLVVWSLAAPLLATASVSKLPWYAYLSYPGIALLLAVSADRLARAVSGRPAVQSALLGAGLLVLAWRLPAEHVWPAEARYIGPIGRLWEVARHDPRIEVVRGPGFRIPRQRDDAGREARLFIRFLSWRRSRSPAGPDSCRATLINDRRDAPPEGDVLELQPPRRGGGGIFLIDGCNGRLREGLGRQSPV